MPYIVKFIIYMYFNIIYNFPHNNRIEVIVNDEKTTKEKKTNYFRN